MKKLNSISLMFPVYKDSRTIKKMIYQSLKILREVSKNFEILIVDDGCPEKTGIIAKKIAKNKENIKIIFHKKNLGYGAAIKTGLKFSKHKWIFQIDGDAEYSVFDLKKLITLRNNADLVITYRKKKKYNTLRIFISWVYYKCIRLLFKIDFLDISTGSRLIKKKILKKINICSTSPFVGEELAIKAEYLGFKVYQVGIQQHPRVFGKGSVISFENILLTIKDMFTLFFRLKLKNYEK